jgi:hypothetical protein
VTGTNLDDDVSRHASRRVHLHPAVWRGTIELNPSDGGRGSERSSPCADADKGDEGEQRPSHTVWIGRAVGSAVPSNEGPRMGRTAYCGHVWELRG